MNSAQVFMHYRKKVGQKYFQDQTAMNKIQYVQPYSRMLFKWLLFVLSIFVDFSTEISVSISTVPAKTVSGIIDWYILLKNITLAFVLTRCH